MDITNITSTTRPLRRIGMGFCGSVWASPSSASSTDQTLAMKREDGGPGRSLNNEHRIHTLLESQSNLSPSSFLIPQNFGFLTPSSSEWAQILPQLPEGHQPCNALLNERIPPLPRTGREDLARRYGPASSEDQQKVLEDVNNEDCLVRIYLGRRRQARQAEKRPRFFSLRNIPLHLDQFAELELDPVPYAEGMADALAWLWWGVGVDGNDVEFVMGGVPGVGFQSKRVVKVFESESLGSHVMWMLDFDCMQRLGVGEIAVEDAARYFWRNDPYFPRPVEDGYGKEVAFMAWKAFRERFLVTSDEILKGRGDQMRGLPRKVIERIITTKGVYSKSAF